MWLGCALALTQTLAHAQAASVRVQGDAGVAVQFSAPPVRVVSLLPSLTETVCALGQCGRLVGVDSYSNFPAQVKKLPQLGGGMTPNIEAIVALRPAVVLMAPSSRSHARLSALGIPVLLLEPKTMADTRRALVTLGQLFGLPESQALLVWQNIETDLTAVAAKMPAIAKNSTVYFEVDSAPYAAGDASFLGELIRSLGLKNIIPAELGAFPLINPEFVVRANPDVIMVGDANASALRARPGWQALKAVQSSQMCVFEREQADALVRPGPRMVAGAQLIVNCLTAFSQRPAQTGKTVK